jgi:serine/threonine protein kinase
MSNEPARLPTIVTDRYTIEKEIGAGGMATVYLARDSKHDREVALKVLRPELGAVLGADRFLAEIKITARLDHPHILTLIDSGAADGLLYYVLPYVRGESLRDLLNRETQLSVEDAIALTKQVGSALDYAHRHGVIHRDIKPENILIQEGEAILTDFGIALAVKEAGGSRLTQTGLSLGTPQYMSPEQATGEKTVGPRSDQYSLAAVLYEMLTGEPPLSGANSQAIIAKLLTEEPSRIRTVRKTVSRGIDDAVAKALAKSPADRFASVGDFLRAIEAAKSNVAADAVEGAAAPSRGRRNPIAIAGVAMAMVAIAIAGFAFRKEGAPKSAPVTVRDRTQLTFSNSVISPSISGDGKQLAYFVRSCPTEKCTFSLVVQDVGSTETRTILDGAVSVYGMEWSPDRRNILIIASYGGRAGIFMVSSLGGRPRFLSSVSASFYSNGDSLIIADNIEPDADSTYSFRITNLSGETGSVLKVRAAGPTTMGAQTIPGSNRILVGFQDGRDVLWQVVARDGRALSQTGNSCTCAVLASADAVWMQRLGSSAGSALVRIALDSATGKLASNQDTLYTGRFSGFSITSSGSHFVVDDGSNEYNIAVGMYGDVIAGKVESPANLKSSIPLQAAVSPDGRRILRKLTVPDGRGSTTLRLSVTPFEGGAETPIDTDGRTLGAFWADSTSVAMATLKDHGVNLSVVDVRTRARTNQLKQTDSVFLGAAALANGWVRIGKAADRLIIVSDGTTREVRKTPWHKDIIGLSVSPDYSQLVYWGWNTTGDSAGFVKVPLDGGTSSHVLTVFGDLPGGSWLGDGSFIAQNQEALGELTLTKVHPDGRIERLRTIPHLVRDFSHSADLKRAALGWRVTKADAFMYQVVKQKE